MQGSKKSEMLEVRVPHETKQALKARAAHERRTVSDIVRELIANYLRFAIVPETQASTFAAGRMSLPHRVFSSRSARVSLAAGMLAVVTFLVLRAPGYAESINVEFDGTFVPMDQSIHSFGKSVTLSPGEVQRIRLGDHSGYELSITASETEPALGEVLLNINVSRRNNDEDHVIGSPAVAISFDRPNRVEFTGPDGGFYGMTIRATATSQS